jgi:hypothetical protein
MARRGRRGFLRHWCSRLGTAVAGMATVGVLGAPGTASAALPGLPTFTVTPSTNLVTGQPVRVSWENQFVGLTTDTFSVEQCAGPWDPSTYLQNCQIRAIQSQAASSGSYYVDVYQAFKPPTGDTRHVCKGTEAGTEQCYVVLVAQGGTPTVRASVPILFYTTSTK